MSLRRINERLTVNPQTNIGILEDKIGTIHKDLQVRTHDNYLRGKVLYVVYQGQEPIYVVCKDGIYDDSDKKEFFTGEELSNYIKKLGVNPYALGADNSSGDCSFSEEFGQEYYLNLMQKLQAQGYLDRIIMLFNPSFMEGNFKPKTEKEINKIKRRVELNAILREIIALRNRIKVLMPELLNLKRLFLER